jgi:tetratricopeptide (TPR) repeat protein
MRRASLAAGSVWLLWFLEGRIRFPLFFLLVLSPALTVAQTSQSLESYLTQAQQLEGWHDYPGAEAVYKEATVAFPDQPEILKRLGILYQTEHKFDASIKAFQKALQRAPAYPQVNFHLAVSCLSLDRIDEALKALSKELALNPGDRQTRRYLAAVYQSLGRKLEAIQQQEPLSLDNPQDSEALYQLLTRIRKDLDKDSGSALLHVLCGQIYEHNHQYANAVSEYKVALRMRFDFPGVHLSLGHDYWKMGRMESSEKELRQGLRRDPHNPVGSYDLATLLAAKQEFHEAIPLLQTSIAGQPKFMRAHLLLGKCYASLEDLKKAIQEFSRAVQLDPKEPSPHFRLARLYARSREKEKSEHELAVFEKLSLQQKQNISKAVEQHTEIQKGKSNEY